MQEKQTLALHAYRIVRLIIPALVSMGMAGFSFAAQSPKAAAESSLVAIVLPPPRIVTNCTLLWTYPETSMPIRFEIQHHTTASYTFRNTADPNAPVEHWLMWVIPESGWSTLAYTTNKFLVIPIRPIRSHLFRLRAEDTSTGKVSEWAGK